jgi:hypothetical protein
MRSSWATFLNCHVSLSSLMLADLCNSSEILCRPQAQGSRKIPIQTATTTKTPFSRGAICKPECNNLLSNKSQQQFLGKCPNLKQFRDYRRLLDKLGKDIDAVTISVPDHNHGVAAIRAMKMGKHCFCQKPLTQTVHEARIVRHLAKEKNLATQMGNQGSAADGVRRAVEVLHAGVISKPQELHVWSNRPIWPQGLDRPAGHDIVPATLNWDAWLGPAHARPYKKDVYNPFKWRGWFDFGTGALGDMACHTVNMPFRRLKLGYPNVVECELASRIYSEDILLAESRHGPKPITTTKNRLRSSALVTLRLEVGLITRIHSKSLHGKP